MLHSYDFFGWLYLNVVICLIDYRIRKQKRVYMASAYMFVLGVTMQ